GSDLGLFWVEVHVPRKATPGQYRGRLLLNVDGTSTPLDVSLKVYAFDLPDRVPFPVTAWVAAKWPSDQAMSPADFRAMLGELLAHGVDPISVGKEFVQLDSNDFCTLDENLEFCFARGLQTFEIPNGDAKPEQIKPLVEHLRQKGWLSKAIVYSNKDEPFESQLHKQNIPYRRQLQTLYPDLRMFLASQYFPAIADACDIWMADVSTGRGAAFAAANHGSASLWFYFCHMPLHADYVRPLVQAPNMEIDNEAIEHRLTLWLAWKYQTTGMFIYAGNSEWVAKGVDRNDWQTKGWTLVDKPYPFPLAGVHNGNGYLLYPGPAPSVRLKVLRDGLEDYGYFMELKKRAAASTNAKLKHEAESLLATPPEVLTDAHYFNRDPLRLLDVRSRMATLIEQLGK
ncbi:MAG: glycoside hydrolase domain-containing protein, partial [Thermoguttaceae bacterium]